MYCPLWWTAQIHIVVLRTPSSTRRSISIWAGVCVQPQRTKTYHISASRRVCCTRICERAIDGDSDRSMRTCVHLLMSGIISYTYKVIHVRCSENDSVWTYGKRFYEDTNVMSIYIRLLLPMLIQYLHVSSFRTKVC